MKSIGVRIAYSDLDSLKPHEESIEERIRYVESSISGSGVLRKPLIADERTGVLIDGTHRYNALKRIGVPAAPVIYVDYLSESEIEIDRWIRIYMLKNVDRGLIGKIADHLNSFSYEPLIEIVRDACIIKLIGKQPADAYRAISQIEKDRGFISNIRAIFFRKSISPRNLKKEYLAIIPPCLSKEEVVEAGITGRPFPPKSTRHITILKKIELHTRIKDLFNKR